MRVRIALGAMLLVLTTMTGCGGAGAVDPATSGGAGSDDGGRPAEAPRTVKVGEPQRIESQSGAKAEVTVLKVTLSKKGRGEFAEAPTNGQYAVVDVRFKVTEGKFAVNPLYLRYQSLDGKTFDSGAGNAFGAGFEPVLASGEVPGGQSIRGVVVFDVPTGKGKQVQLTDELGDLVGAWQI